MFFPSQPVGDFGWIMGRAGLNVLVPLDLR